MKSTKTVLAVAIVIAGFASLGCGSDVAGGVTRADAQRECNSYQIISTGEPISAGLLDAYFIEAEAFRDDGLSESSYLTGVIAGCEVADPGREAREQCFVCGAAIAAIVWP